MSNLWFDTWTPTSAGATFGACLGLFFLAAFSRLLAVVSSAAESAWAQRAALVRSAATLSRSSSIDTLDGKDQAARPAVDAGAHRAPPFLLAVDFPRGVLFMFQGFVSYLLMLAVMSYSASFFIAILVGLGAGEMAFGRFKHHDGHGGGIHP